MWPEEENAVGYATPERTPTDLEIVSRRLSGISEVASKVCGQLNDFLARCGRSPGPEASDRGRGEKPREVGHFGDINATIEEIAGKVEFLSAAADRISRLG